MITYKIRDNLLLSYDGALFFYEGEIWETFYRGVSPDRFICIRKTIDQSRYTIEGEISDDVLEKMYIDLCPDTERERFDSIIKKYLNKKTS